MQKLISKTKTQELTAIGLLIAVTVVLSYVSGYLRIGNISKFSISFVSVFVSGASFGSLIGGFVGASADIISYLVNPTGPFLWQLTIIEFLFGALYGLLFYKKRKNGLISLWCRIIACVLIQLAINLFLKTLVLTSTGLIPSSFISAVVMRAPGCIITSLFQVLLLRVINSFIPQFLKLIYKRGK